MIIWSAAVLYDKYFCWLTYIILNNDNLFLNFTLQANIYIQVRKTWLIIRNTKWNIRIINTPVLPEINIWMKEWDKLEKHSNLLEMCTDDEILSLASRIF